MARRTLTQEEKKIIESFLTRPTYMQGSDFDVPLSEEEKLKRRVASSGSGLIGFTPDELRDALDALRAKPNEEPAPLPELPMPEGEQARIARRRSLLKQRKRRGRESTILTSPMSLLSEEIGV